MELVILATNKLQANSNILLTFNVGVCIQCLKMIGSVAIKYISNLYVTVLSSFHLTKRHCYNVCHFFRSFYTYSSFILHK